VVGRIAGNYEIVWLFRLPFENLNNPYTVKHIIIIPLVITVLLSCNSTTDQTPEPQKNLDTTPAKAISSKEEDEANNENDLDMIMADYKEMADKPHIKDTMLLIDGDTFHVLVKHYPVPDSPIIVPKKYAAIFKLDSFSTSSLKTSVTITKNGKAILQREISKNDFLDLLYPALKDYAVLFTPDISSADGHIELHYSISIPLTDVGIGVAALIDKNGSIEFKGR
jgi:hypothetical protein